MKLTINEIEFYKLNYNMHKTLSRACKIKFKAKEIKNRIYAIIERFRSKSITGPIFAASMIIADIAKYSLIIKSKNVKKERYQTGGIVIPHNNGELLHNNKEPIINEKTRKLFNRQAVKTKYNEPITIILDGKEIYKSIKEKND